MAPPTRTSRATWIDAGLHALATGGPEAVRIEPLAQRLGVTRGGFYGHFKNRHDFIDEMLDTWSGAAPTTCSRESRARGATRGRACGSPAS